MNKPAYSMSRRAFWFSFVAAWGVLIALTVGALRGSQEAVTLATIAFPSMVGVVVALLGIHRAYGSADMKTVAEASARIPPDMGGQ